MRIDYIQISNVLSFPFVANIEDAQKIVFNDGLNIIIGENGSGKSTALEVINFLFRRVIYRQFSFNKELFDRRRTATVGETKNVIQAVNQNNFGGFRLDPNWDSPDSPQVIRISLKLDSIDVGNIENIKENFEKIFSRVADFSHHAVDDKGIFRENYVIDVTLNRNSNNFSVSFGEQGHDFGCSYLTDYNFFKESIGLHNYLNEGDVVPQLFESFTLIGSYRNYHKFNPSVSLVSAPASEQIQQIRDQDYNRSLNTTDAGEPSVFALVRLQVAEKHFSSMNSKSEQECEIEANDLPFIRSINERLKAINLRCQIRLTDMRTWQYNFQFFDTRRNKSIDDINVLSAGQKAIVHLVLEAYGRGDLKGGVVIIDEPEIHLHYQLQHEYIKVLRDLNNIQNCQYVLVTHSEALINSSTINSVMRFSLDISGRTVINSPTIGEDQKLLIKILDNTRSTYAFFSKKVILVEGDSDRFFYRALLQELYPNYDQEIAVLHITGKREFIKWRGMFRKFGLSVFCIADFDYILEREYPTLIGTKLNRSDLVDSFKESHPDWEERIQNQSLDNVFILRDGDLESYLGINKDFGRVIEFCRDKLALWIRSDESPQAQELRSVLHKIVS